MPLDIENLKDSYFQWLKQKTKLKDLDGVIQITTPMIDRYNDYLQIYVVPKEGHYKLTDDSYILNDLTMSGCDIFNSNKRIEILEVILNGFGVKRQNEELYVEASSETFPQKKHALLQAMMTVNDMFMTTRENVKSIFLEDVEAYLQQNEIRYTENIAFVGKSGFNHSFDFVIPRFKKEPERIIKAINNPTREKSEALLFAWDDTRETRKSDAMLFAFLNDSEKGISKNIINAFAEYDVKPVPWSKRKNYIESLSA